MSKSICEYIFQQMLKWDLALTILGPVVQRVDNFIQRINPYPEDKICSLSNQN